MSPETQHWHQALKGQFGKDYTVLISMVKGSKDKRCQRGTSLLPISHSNAGLPAPSQVFSNICNYGLSSIKNQCLSLLEEHLGVLRSGVSLCNTKIFRAQWLTKAWIEKKCNCTDICFWLDWVACRRPMLPLRTIRKTGQNTKRNHMKELKR